MSVGLYGSAHQLRLATDMWEQFLDLAQVYGWESEGTTLDTDDPDAIVQWTGGYAQMAQWQSVTATDAAALAASLSEALSTIHNDDQRAALQAIIALCAAGGFKID